MVDDFVLDDVLIRDAPLTNQYFAGKKVRDIGNYKYVREFDEKQRQGSLVLGAVQSLRSRAEDRSAGARVLGGEVPKPPQISTEKVGMLLE